MTNADDKGHKYEINEGDWFLAHFVSMANSLTLDMDITLIVSGTIVSGVLTSGKQYFESVADGFNKSLNNNSAGGVYKKMAEMYAEKENKIGFVHLKEAKIYAPGQTGTPNNGMFLRVRLSEISAFNLGRFT